MKVHGVRGPKIIAQNKLDSVIFQYNMTNTHSLAKNQLKLTKNPIGYQISCFPVVRSCPVLWYLLKSNLPLPKTNHGQDKFPY